MDASTTHPFACPHCGAVNQVPAASLGQVASCASCAKPFRAEIPAGRPLAPAQAQAQTQASGGGGIPFDVPAPAPAPVPAKPAPAAAGFATLRIHPAPWRARVAATSFDAVLVLAGLAFAGWAFQARKEPMWMWFFLCGGATLGVVGAVNLLLPWIRSRTETLEITAASTRWTKGFLRRRSVEIRHDAVRAVEVEQTFAQRLLGIGTLTLASDGGDQDEIVMRDLPGVKEVAEKIRGLQGK